MQLSAPTDSQTGFLGRGRVGGGGVCSVGAVIGVYNLSEEKLWREGNTNSEKTNIQKKNGV